MSQKSISQYHSHKHDDYAEATQQILMALGDLDELELFGKQVVVASYIRPQRTPKGAYVSMKSLEEDAIQGKIVMIVKAGPEAFHGTADYIASTFGEGRPVPKPGDWMILRPQDGTMISLMGDGSKHAKAKDHRGDEIDLYDWDGWPCKIVTDEAFIGRVRQPHVLV